MSCRGRRVVVAAVFIRPWLTRGATALLLIEVECATIECLGAADQQGRTFMLHGVVLIQAVLVVGGEERLAGAQMFRLILCLGQNRFSINR
jgi:hypothetical protein